jgi:hypothetical protein
MITFIALDLFYILCLYEFNIVDNNKIIRWIDKNGENIFYFYMNPSRKLSYFKNLLLYSQVIFNLKDIHEKNFLAFCQKYTILNQKSCIIHYPLYTA